MTKSKRAGSKKNSSRKMKLSGHHATFNDITRWYLEIFEQMGWMVLANAHGYQGKINCYKISISKFKMAVETKLSQTKDADQKQDLTIMLDYITILQNHVNKDFK
jgi:hypothetical protein